MPGKPDPAEQAGRELQAQSIARAILDLLGSASEWVGTAYALKRALGITDKRFVGKAGMKTFAKEFAGGRVAELLLEHGVQVWPKAFKWRNPDKAEALFKRVKAPVARRGTSVKKATKKRESAGG